MLCRMELMDDLRGKSKIGFLINTDVHRPGWLEVASPSWRHWSDMLYGIQSRLLPVDSVGRCAISLLVANCEYKLNGQYCECVYRGCLASKSRIFAILYEDVLELSVWIIGCRQRILLAAMATKEATFLGVSLIERRIT
jgi:hypothetical protein